MATAFFLYPSLTDEIKEGLFQAKEFKFSYTGHDGLDKDLVCETAEINSSINCLKTDGVWNADSNNLCIRRIIALKNYRKLFGPDGIACRNARLGLSLVWTSSDSKQRGSISILEFGIDEAQLSAQSDHSFIQGEIDVEFPPAKLRGDIELSVMLYVSKAGIPAQDETHLANEEGFILGAFDSYILRIDGTGSLFPVYEVFEQDKPLWSVRCDWIDPVADQFSETVSININTAHKNYRFIDRSQKAFCSQLLVEVMSAALCCIIEKLRTDKYLDQILGADEMEPGSVGEVVRYFANTLEWDFTTPDKLSLSTRKFFDGRLAD